MGQIDDAVICDDTTKQAFKKKEAVEEKTVIVFDSSKNLNIICEFI